MAGAQDTSGMSHLACSFTNLPLSFPIITFFSPWARDRALRRDLDSRNVFPFSHDAPGGDMAISVPVREAVSASPMGWGRGLTVEMSLSISCCHTNRGRATNGLFFQSFLAAVFFFVCALSSIHLFMSPFSSPLFSLPPLSSPSLLPISYCPPSPPKSNSCLSLCLSTCLSDLAAVVRSSAGSDAGVSGGQAARRKPAPSSQPGHTLPAQQPTLTERQGPQLPAIKQDQGEGKKTVAAARVCVCACWCV